MQDKKQWLELDMEQLTGSKLGKEYINMEQLTGSKLGKEYIKTMYCHPAYLISMQNISYEMLNESQAGIKIIRRKIKNLRYIDNNMLMAESEEELMTLLMKEKEESEKAGLKLNIKRKKKKN